MSKRSEGRVWVGSRAALDGVGDVLAECRVVGDGYHILATEVTRSVVRAGVESDINYLRVAVHTSEEKGSAAKRIACFKICMKLEHLL